MFLDSRYLCQQITYRYQIQEKGREEAGHRCANGGKRNSSGNGPGNERRYDNGGIFKIQRHASGIRLQLAAKLICQHDG